MSPNEKRKLFRRAWVLHRQLALHVQAPAHHGRTVATAGDVSNAVRIPALAAGRGGFEQDLAVFPSKVNTGLLVSLPRIRARHGEVWPTA